MYFWQKMIQQVYKICLEVHFIEDYENKIIRISILDEFGQNYASHQRIDLTSFITLTEGEKMGHSNKYSALFHFVQGTKAYFPIFPVTY